jgi:hypothetical protein
MNNGRNVNDNERRSKSRKGGGEKGFVKKIRKGEKEKKN